MNKDWPEFVKTRLELFQLELANLCRRYGREPNSVNIIYATKYLDSQQFAAFLLAARELHMAPVIVGENKVQEMERKTEYIHEKHPERINYFNPVMIGSLQRNKINKALRYFRQIQTVDNIELARALENRLARDNKQLAVFLELNISGEGTKHGTDMFNAERFIAEAGKLPHLKITGLMTMAPLITDMEEIRPIFHDLKKIAQRHKLSTSMGMSNDWKVAVEEGADYIRIGRRIFQ